MIELVAVMALLAVNWLFMVHLMYLGDLEIWHDRRRLYVLTATVGATELIVVATVLSETGCLT